MTDLSALIIPAFNVIAGALVGLVSYLAKKNIDEQDRKIRDMKNEIEQLRQELRAITKEMTANNLQSAVTVTRLETVVESLSNLNDGTSKADRRRSKP